MIRTLESAAFLVSLLLTGTGCLSRPSMAKESFAFTAPGGGMNASAGKTLEVRRIWVAPQFDSRSFIYRTGEFSFERDPYAQFLVPPGQSLLSAISGYFQTECGVADVVTYGTDLRPDLLLELRVLQLYGDFRDKENPSAVLELNFAFSDSRSRKLVLQREVRERVPLKARTAEALMVSWDQALRQAMREICSALREKALVQ